MRPARTKKHWTADEIDYLRTAAPELTSREIAEHLGRSREAVSLAARKRGIKLMIERMADGSIRRRWTPREVTILYGLAESHTMRGAAKKLKRSYQAVKRKADKLGISFRKGRLTVDGVAEILGVTPNTVIRRRDKLGLWFRTTSQNHRYPKGLTRGRQMRGATGEDIVAIAQDMLDDPPRGKELKPTAKYLRQVIQEYQGWE